MCMAGILYSCNHSNDSKDLVFETGYMNETNDIRATLEETNQKQRENTVEQAAEQMSKQTTIENCTEAYATIHICGAVKNPGVYTVPADCRYEQALQAAGGVTSDGAKDYLNLADIVSDGEKLYVPFLKEVDDRYGLSSSEKKISQKAEKLQESQMSDGNDSSPININLATAAQLQRLNGIGEVRAEAIIQYREENGPFKTIEEIMNVSGIKEGAFLKIKDEITVE